MQTWATGSGGQRGFTLLELLVALTIMVGLIGLVPIAFDRVVPKRRLQAEVYAVAHELRQLKNQARASGLSQPVRAANDRGVLVLGAREHRTVDDISVKVPEQIMFFADGSTSGGVIVLESSAGAWTIDIGMVSGSLRVERT